MVSELWKDIPGYESYYQVSDGGGVQSLDREILTTRGSRYCRGRILSMSKHPSGHLKVNLCVNNKTEQQWVHQLVLKTFVGPRPEGCESCHNDGNPSNNHLTNLRWDTRSENRKDIYRHGYKSVLSKRVKRSDGRVFDSIRIAARYMEISHSEIRESIIRSGTCHDYRWEYV